MGYYGYKSEKAYKSIKNYYMYLYDNYEIKSIKEIAEYLDMAAKTVREFIDDVYNGMNLEGGFSKFDIVILTTTEFGANSKYLEDQKRLSKLIIRRCAIKLLMDQKKKLEKQEEKQEEKQQTIKK